MRLTRPNWGTGHYGARLVTGSSMLEHEVAMVAPSDAIVDESDARVEAVEGAVAP